MVVVAQAFLGVPKFGIFIASGFAISILIFLFKYHTDEGVGLDSTWNRKQNRDTKDSGLHTYRGYAAAIPVVGFILAGLLGFGIDQIFKLFVQ